MENLPILFMCASFSFYFVGVGVGLFTDEQTRKALILERDDLRAAKEALEIERDDLQDAVDVLTSCHTILEIDLHEQSEQTKIVSGEKRRIFELYCEQIEISSRLEKIVAQHEASLEAGAASESSAISRYWRLHGEHIQLLDERADLVRKVDELLRKIEKLTPRRDAVGRFAKPV